MTDTKSKNTSYNYMLHHYMISIGFTASNREHAKATPYLDRTDAELFSD